MKLKILLLVSLFMSWIAALAGQSVSTNRIWNVGIYDRFNSYHHGIRIISDGTFEWNGFQYNRFSVVEKFEFTSDGDGRDRILYPCDGDRAFSYYLREENGVVYCLVRGGWQGFDTENERPFDYQEYVEFQLFDFNANPGDTYLSLRTNENVWRSGCYGYKELIPAEVQVLSVDTIEIGGQTVRRQLIGMITDPATGQSVTCGPPVEVIESVGIVDSGFPFAFVVRLPSDGVCWANVMTTSLTDLDRNILREHEWRYIPETTDNIAFDDACSVEFHKKYLNGDGHLLWNVSGDGNDESISVRFDSLRKWKGSGHNVELLDPVDYSGESKEYSLINRGHKTSLRVKDSKGDLIEYPLYDFGKYRTEKFNSVMANIVYQGDMPVLQDFTPIVCTIDSVGFYYKEQDDDEKYIKCQCISEVFVPSTGETILPDENSEYLFMLVEGVGNIDYPLMYIRNFYDVAMNKVRYTNGEIIQMGENIAVPDVSHTPVNLIRPDREWEYVSYSADEEKKVFRRMKFDGTETIGDQTYNRWVTFKTTEISYTSQGNLAKVSIDNSIRDIRLLREENSKVYMLVSSVGSQNGGEPVEMGLYDFTQRPDDIVIGCADENDATGFRIEETGIVEIEGENCLVQSYNQRYAFWDTMIDGLPIYSLYGESFAYKMIEGIGFDGWGTMTYIPVWVTTEGYPNAFINNVYNANGEIVYKGRNEQVPISEYDGIGELTEDAVNIEHADGKITVSGVEAIEIYGVDGRLVCSHKTLGAKIEISENTLPKGFCIIKALASDKLYSFKIVL